MRKVGHVPYYTNYPKVEIGGSNPYQKCACCGISEPEINGKLENHGSHCKWANRKKRQIEVSI